MEVSRVSALIHRRCGATVLRSSLLLRPPSVTLPAYGTTNRSASSDTPEASPIDLSDAMEALLEFDDSRLDLTSAIRDRSSKNPSSASSVSSLMSSWLGAYESLLLQRSSTSMFLCGRLLKLSSSSATCLRASSPPAPLVRQATPTAVSSSIDLSDAFEALLEFDD
jgi:hypothetical protein